MTEPAFPTAAYNRYCAQLSALTDDERIAFVLDLGRDARPRPTDAAEMSGCQARVWIAASEASDGRLAFTGSSEATIVQGLVRIMAESFSGLTAQELAVIGLDAVRAFPLGAMTTHRQVGMMAMLKHMQRMAAR